MPAPGFRADFTWGAATAAYQIEGAPAADGKGDSVWDMMCCQPGRIWQGQTGDVACDHYHRWEEDVALMATLGLQAYRFSLSWPRILPGGDGAVNARGLDFYDRLVDGLLARGIEPWVTLFHWDYPLALFHRGGWLHPDSPRWFADYAGIVVERLSDRVRHWITLNEPQCFIWYGHGTGMHAPGLQYCFEEVVRAGHHTLLAHGLGVQAIRAAAKTPALVGWAPVGVTYHPATDAPADIAAARRMTFANTDRSLWSNSWWADPVVFGRYPEDALRRFGDALPAVPDSDFTTIRQPIDFYGANIYTGCRVAAGPDGEPAIVCYPDGHPHTHFHWNLTPETLYWGARFLHERYRLPLVITENGMSSADWVSLDGRVHDPQRIDFLARYLGALKAAARDGVDLRGYFHWSLLDNFEWAEGYKQRFGLIHVDYATQRRTPKDSAAWFAEVIRTHGAALDPRPPAATLPA
jgi:beta-glucosidase